MSPQEQHLEAIEQAMNWIEEACQHKDIQAEEDESICAWYDMMDSQGRNTGD